MSNPESTVPEREVDRRPYLKPTLRVFGTVAAITAAANKTGAVKDGGPNNLKT